METSNGVQYWKFAVGLVLILFIPSILLPAASWAADIDVFATIEGLQCQGLSTDSRFPDAIVVRSLSGGISNSSTIGGSGLGGGRSVPAPLKIAKDFDACSPLLFRAGVVGRHFSRVTISFVTDANSPVFFEIQLTDAVVENMTLGANDALGQTSEEVSFIFRRMKLTDTVILQSGAGGGQVVVECDFVQNSCS
jgi:type VI secretion system Hcp family effector